MRSVIVSSLAITAMLTGSALAGSKGFLAMHELARIIERQSGAFVPPTGTVDQCASDQLECGTGQVPRPTCYTPSIGQICCSDGHACTEDSFCLFAPYCCPNGLSPEACAAQYGVTLPPNFQTSTLASAPAAATQTSSSSIIPAASTANGSAPYVPPTASAPAGNGTVATPSTPTSPALFTGAAAATFNNNHAQVGGIAAVVLGALGMLGFVL